MNPWKFENGVWINHDTKQVLSVEEWDNLRCIRTAELEAELATWQRLTIDITRAEAIRELASAQDENKRLREALVLYGEHHWTCQSTYGTGKPCDCTFGALTGDT